MSQPREPRPQEAAGLDGEPADLTYLNALELRLASVTNDWNRPSLVRIYAPDGDGQEDYLDEALLFDIHGYESDAVEGSAAKVTYRRRNDADREENVGGRSSDRIRDPFVVPPEDPTATVPELQSATQGWTSASVLRSYRNDHRGLGRLQAETEELAKHGYIQSTVVDTKGRVKAKTLILTGGLGAAINYARGTGGIHEVGTRTVTFVKHIAAAPDAAGSLRQLAELRREGVITENEYAAKKAEILKRL